MDRTRLKEELSHLSLDDEEVEVYLSLLDLGEAKASTVAEAAGIHRTTSYRILKGMADRGIVEVGVGRPMEFRPASPERLFEEIRREKSRELERVDEIESDLRDPLESLHAGAEAADSGSGSWRMISGRERIVEEAVGVLETAQAELRYLATDPIQGREKQNVETDWESTLAEVAPRVDARILVNPEPVAEDVLEAFFATKGIEVRFATTQARAQSALIDGQTFVWVVIGEEPEEDVALWSDAPDLYTSQRLLFDGLWERADRPEP